MEGSGLELCKCHDKGLRKVVNKKIGYVSPFAGATSDVLHRLFEDHGFYFVGVCGIWARCHHVGCTTAFL